MVDVVACKEVLFKSVKCDINRNNILYLLLATRATDENMPWDILTKSKEWGRVHKESNIRNKRILIRNSSN